MKEKLIYKKGTRIIINIKGNIRHATIKEDVKDFNSKIKVNVDNFPFDISVNYSDILL